MGKRSVIDPSQNLGCTPPATQGRGGSRQLGSPEQGPLGGLTESGASLREGDSNTDDPVFARGVHEVGEFGGNPSRSTSKDIISTETLIPSAAPRHHRTSPAKRRNFPGGPTSVSYGPWPISSLEAASSHGPGLPIGAVSNSAEPIITMANTPE